MRDALFPGDTGPLLVRIVRCALFSALIYVPRLVAHIEDELTSFDKRLCITLGFLPTVDTLVPSTKWRLLPSNGQQ